MAEDSPLHHFFATLGQGSVPHAADVNAEATTRLEQVLKTPVEAPGRGILLRAPRAGFGKTHLISQVQQRLASTHEFLPLTLLDGARLDATVAVESALRRLTRQLPAGGGLTALDLQARRILALSLQPLVASGEVPCQDRESALAALRQRPVETFDFHQPQAVTAQWTRENFEVLGPRLALELSRLTSCSLNETSFWLAAIFRFSVAAPDHPGRTGMIIQSATSEAGVERFAALISLLTLILRVVLIADDLEGLHADPSGALRLASFLAAVRQDAPRTDAIVSINDDIWSSSFQPALSGGLLDRLGEVEIRLGPLSDDNVVALLNERAAGRGAELMSRLSLAPDERYSRKVLRLAADRFHELPLPGSQIAAPRQAEMPAPAADLPDAARVNAMADPFADVPTQKPVFAAAAGGDTPASEPEAPSAPAAPEPDPAKEEETPVLPESEPASESARPAAVARPYEPEPFSAVMEVTSTRVVTPTGSPFTMEPSSEDVAPLGADEKETAPSPFSLEPDASLVSSGESVASPFTIASTEVEESAVEEKASEASPVDPQVAFAAQASPFSAFQTAPGPSGPVPAHPSPFRATSQEPEPKPAESQPATPVEEEKPVSAAKDEASAAAAGGDRIDDLLRQFRDRYGRD